MGDLFFVLVNIARYLSLDPESALQENQPQVQTPVSMDGRPVARSGRAPIKHRWKNWKSLWQQAKQQEQDAGVSAEAIVIRKCHELDEMRACVALQKEVWNFSDAELVPLAHVRGGGKSRRASHRRI